MLAHIRQGAFISDNSGVNEIDVEVIFAAKTQPTLMLIIYCIIQFCQAKP